MTSQPDSPATDRMGIDEYAPAAQDPDLIIVAGEVVDEDTDPDAPDTEAGDDLTGAQPDAYLADGLQNETDRSDNGRIEDNVRPADLGQQWHDIQAMFVDDPRGSVELAAAAADSAVSELLETLHQRQSALAPAGTTSADPGGTEQLREALRSYRIFCQSLTEIGQRFTQPATMTQ